MGASSSADSFNLYRVTIHESLDASQSLNEERMDKSAKVPRGFEVGDKGEHNLHPAEPRLSLDYTMVQ